MKTILIFTNNDSIKKHWKNIIPKEYETTLFENVNELIEYLEIEQDITLMLDESSLENILDVLTKLKKFTLTKVMLFNNEINLPHITSLLVYGIKSYENSYLNAEVLKNVMTTVSSGNKWLQAELTTFLISNYVNNSSLEIKKNVYIEVFTAKEKEVLTFITQGMSNAEIARELTISLSTVKGHIKHIFEKAEIKDRLNLALKYKGFI